MSFAAKMKFEGLTSVSNDAHFVAPYPYQSKFATQATLPHLLRVPTSTGWKVVVQQPANDLRLAFADMKGLTKENLFRTRKFYLASREIHAFLNSPEAGSRKVATVSPQITPTAGVKPIVATVSPE